MTYLDDLDPLTLGLIIQNLDIKSILNTGASNVHIHDIVEKHFDWMKTQINKIVFSTDEEDEEDEKDEVSVKCFMQGGLLRMLNSDAVSIVVLPKNTKLKKCADSLEDILQTINKYISFCNSEIDFYREKDTTENNIWTMNLNTFTELYNKLNQGPNGAAGGGNSRRKSYDSLTVHQLKEQAKRKQIRGYSKLNKAELVKALRSCKTRK